MKPLKLSFLGIILSFIIIIFIFLPSPAFAEDCSSETPASAPDLYQVSVSKDTANIYFAEPNTQFTGFIISYGLTGSADAYSVSFPMGKIDGAVKYTINDLFPKTNYFFKVRAVNNCAAGPWSVIKNTNIQNAGSLPETGPNNSLLGIGLGGLLFLLVGMGLLFAI